MIFGGIDYALTIAFFVLLVEWLVGWPAPLLSTIGHPVIWLGRMINYFESKLRGSADLSDQDGADLVRGAMLVLLIVLIPVIASIAVLMLFGNSLAGDLVVGFCALSLLASRSLYTHVEDVWEALIDYPDSLDIARLSLSRIVGRDTHTLDENAVCQGAIESLAESTSDGVVAPLFWLVLLGLPGLVLYKAVNTMDSMIGYRNQQYEYFGKVAAQADDVLNFVPARLTAVLFLLAAGKFKWQTLCKVAVEARMHLSPNAGWPEAAMANLLGITLGGERYYGERLTQGAVFNEGAPAPDQRLLRRSLDVYKRCILLVLGLLLGLLVTL